MKYEQNKDLKKHRRNRFNGPVWDGFSAPSPDSGIGDARFELVFNLCTENIQATSILFLIYN